MVIAFFAMILAIFALKNPLEETLISRIFETPYGHDSEFTLEFSKLLKCKWLADEASDLSLVESPRHPAFDFVVELAFGDESVELVIDRGQRRRVLAL